MCSGVGGARVHEFHRFVAWLTALGRLCWGCGSKCDLACEHRGCKKIIQYYECYSLLITVIIGIRWNWGQGRAGSAESHYCSPVLCGVLARLDVSLFLLLWGLLGGEECLLGIGGGRFASCVLYRAGWLVRLCVLLCTTPWGLPGGE